MFRALTALLVSAVLTAAPAQAIVTDFPALYNVAGVASDDVLNVRDAPASSAAIVATLPATRTGLEVLGPSDDGAWMRVGLGEISGWVSARFLEAQTPRAHGSLPIPMRCYGTEPFWGLNFPAGDFAEFERLPEPEAQFRIADQATPLGGKTGEIAARLTGENAAGTVVLRREYCSDEMSDRDFGLSVLFLLERGDASVLHAGCCSLTGG